MVAWTRLWILLSAVLVSAGWILSAFHELNRVGYGIIFGLAAGAALVFRPIDPAVTGGGVSRAFYKIVRRGRRSMPRLFFAVACLSLLAGILYLPSNGDTNSYRIPRVFHWLGQEQWHWIHTLDARMNIAGTGFEWLCAPIALFTGYDHVFFLVNWVSYLLLPGLIYSTFIRLSVRPKVAWWWMWLLSGGWCYVWQAQSTVNDSFSVIYALASVDLALRARQSGRIGDWWLAVLAAGLLTGAKQTCIPLALVSAIALWPGLRPMIMRPVPTLLVLALALLVSAAPVTVFNLDHTHNWMGTIPHAAGWSNTVLKSPFWGVIGNTFCLTMQNLVPPLFPWYEAWNSAMQHFVQTPFGSHFSSFENFCFLSQATDEASSGIGMFLCLFTWLSLWWVIRHKTAGAAVPAVPADGLIRLLWLAPWVALLAFMAKVGSYENARQLAPYYVFFFPVLLAAPGHVRLVRQRWWRQLAGLISLASVLIVVTSRSSPLFPAQTLFGWLHDKYPHSKSLAHALASFTSHQAVEIQRHAFHSEIPPEEKVIGYYSAVWCGAEPGFWQPFGIRKVERILPGDPAAGVRSLKIHYIVVDDLALAWAKQSLEDWRRDYDADVVGEATYETRWGSPPQHLYLARLRPVPAN